MFYSYTFDVRDPRNNLGTITFRSSGHPGTPDVSFALSAVYADDDPLRAQQFNHYALGQATGPYGVDTQPLSMFSAENWGDAVQAWFLAIAVTWSPSSTIAWDSSNLRYLITSSDIVRITFSTAEGAGLFGFANLVNNFSGSVYSDITPDFLIRTTLSACSLPSPDYEPGDIASAANTSNTTQFGLARTVVPLHRDWVQQYELASKVIRREASSSHPMTIQKGFESARNVLPFLVVQGFGEAANDPQPVFCLQAGFSNWGTNTVQRQLDDAGDLYNVNYKTVYLGDVEL